MSKKPLYLFGDIVVIENALVGVVVKTWEDRHGFYYEIYVRSLNGIKQYREEEVERYRVRHKELNEEEVYWQNS